MFIPLWTIGFNLTKLIICTIIFTYTKTIFPLWTVEKVSKMYYNSLPEPLSLQNERMFCKLQHEDNCKILNLTSYNVLFKNSYMHVGWRMQLNILYKKKSLVGWDNERLTPLQLHGHDSLSVSWRKKKQLIPESMDFLLGTWYLYMYFWSSSYWYDII